MRRWLALAAVMATTAVVAAGAAVPVGAGEAGNSVFVFRKVVTGPATAGSAILLECETAEDASITATTQVVLHFDATGAPSTVDGPSETGFEVIDGAWVLDTTVPPYPALDRPDCTVTEVDTGGASSTAWTCSFTFEAGTADPPIGCAAAAGTGVGPVTATFGDTRDEIVTQTWTVVLTNTYPELPVEVEPNFTG